MGLIAGVAAGTVGSAAFRRSSPSRQSVASPLVACQSGVKRGFTLPVVASEQLPIPLCTQLWRQPWVQPGALQLDVQIEGRRLNSGAGPPAEV